MEGFKGHDKDLKCRGFQYEIGEVYKCDKAAACDTGFHFCEYPLDVFNYYPPAESRYTQVEGGGQTDKGTDDSKVACTELKINTEISIKSLIDAAVKFTLDRVKWEKKPQATNTGDQSAATNTGDQGVAMANAATC